MSKGKPLPKIDIFHPLSDANIGDWGTALAYTLLLSFSKLLLRENLIHSLITLMNAMLRI